LRTVMPLEAEVTLAPSPPGEEVRIRTDQWNVLTAVGTRGLSVRSVLEKIGGEQMAGLRALRDLRAAGLIAVGGSEAPHGTAPGVASGGTDAGPTNAA